MKKKMNKLCVFISLCLCVFILFLIPALTEAKHFRFIVLGDTRPMLPYVPQSYPFQKILEEVNLIYPDFVINVGDLIVGYMCDEKEVRRQYEDYIRTIRKCLVPYYNVVGNHEVAGEKGEELYKVYLGDLYYSFDYENSHFVILDTDINADIGKYGDTGRLGERQFKWLKKDLEKNKDKENIFVFFHKPMFFDEDDREASIWTDKEERDKVHSLFKEYKVKMVFMGDIHIYKRLNIDGITYYITGGGGAEQLEFEHLGGLGIYHYLLVYVKDGEIEVKVITPLHLWVEYYPSYREYMTSPFNRNNRVTAYVYNSAWYLSPLKIRGLRFIMPKLKEGEEYKISPPARIWKIEEKDQKTNIVYVTLFLRPPIGVSSVTLEISSQKIR